MKNKETNSASNIAILLLLIASAIFLKIGYINDESWYGGLIVSLPLLFFFAFDARLQNRRKENFPVTGFPTRKELPTIDHPGDLNESNTSAFLRRMNEQNMPMAGHRFFKRSKTQYNKIVN